jgi:hypothetical protein
MKGVIMNALQVITLQKEIEEQLKEQADDLEKEIAVGCKETDSTEVICGKMIANAIAISTRISLGAVLDILIEAGIVSPYSDNELRRKNLSIVKQQNE